MNKSGVIKLLIISIITTCVCIFIFFYRWQNSVKELGKDLDEYISLNIIQVNKKFSYAEPKHYAIDAARLEQFIEIRTKLSQSIDIVFWSDKNISKSFGKSDFSFILDFDILLDKYKKMADELFALLNENKMSFKEYAYIYIVVSSVVVSETEKGNPSGVIPGERAYDSLSTTIATNHPSEKLYPFEYACPTIEKIDSYSHSRILNQLKPYLIPLADSFEKAYLDILFFDDYERNY